MEGHNYLQATCRPQLPAKIVETQLRAGVPFTTIEKKRRRETALSRGREERGGGAWGNLRLSCGYRQYWLCKSGLLATVSQQFCSFLRHKEMKQQCLYEKLITQLSLLNGNPYRWYSNSIDRFHRRRVSTKREVLKKTFLFSLIPFFICSVLFT